MGTKGKGLLALLGLSALAFWKYKTSSPEDQQAVKDTINNAKDNLSKWGNDLKDKATDVVDQVKDKATNVADQVKDKANDVQASAENSASNH